MDDAAAVEFAAAEEEPAEITGETGFSGGELDPDELNLSEGADSVPTVLIVDDSPTVRKLVSMTLEKQGYHVVGAVDGMELSVCGR